jgi:hypothetical protein
LATLTKAFAANIFSFAISVALAPERGEASGPFRGLETPVPLIRDFIGFNLNFWR